MSKQNRVIISGSFDDLRIVHVRLLDEASQLGEVHVLLWADSMIIKQSGYKPRFPLDERLYLLESLRYVQKVWVVGEIALETVESLLAQIKPRQWVLAGGNQPDSILDPGTISLICQRNNLGLMIIDPGELSRIPEVFEALLPPPPPQRVIVTGCYDWLHSGHVRFFEEAAAFGSLVVSVGSDANVRMLKGEHHPLFPAEQRRYMVQAVRFVASTVIGSGEGWLDAAPEIERLQPDYYLVNEDGDRAGKRLFCAEHGIQYVILQRNPRQGLPRRESSLLRGY